MSVSTLTNLTVYATLSFTQTAKANAKGKTQDTQRKVSFSIEKIWKSYRKNDCCACDDDDKLIAGVQKFYTGARTATWTFRGPSYVLADNAVLSLESYLTKLIYLTNTNSTVLADSSTSILETMSKHKTGANALSILIVYIVDFPTIVKDMKEVVEKLSDLIGKLASSFNDDLTEVFLVLSNFMKRFLECKTLKCKEKLDYIPVIRKFQTLMNTVALFAETLINKCDTASHEAYQAVTILSIVFNYFTISVQGINTCVQDIVFNDNGIIADKIRSLSESMQYVVLEITQAVNGITFPFDKTITEWLTLLVNVTIAFNKSVKDILGVFKGVVITVGEISQNLGKRLKDRTNILTGITPK